jgi:hypothetical protein
MAPVLFCAGLENVSFTSEAMGLELEMTFPWVVSDSRIVPKTGEMCEPNKHLTNVPSVLFKCGWYGGFHPGFRTCFKYGGQFFSIT